MVIRRGINGPNKVNYRSKYKKLFRDDSVVKDSNFYHFSYKEIFTLLRARMGIRGLREGKKGTRKRVLPLFLG